MHAICHVMEEKEVEDEADLRLPRERVWADSLVISQLMMGRGQAEAVPPVHYVCLPVDSFSHPVILPLAAGLCGVVCSGTE